MRGNFKNHYFQALTAGLLYKLAQLEEGRRYLKFSSKITNDLKKVIRKKASKLEFDTLESLNATLNLMHPPLAQHLNVTYYCKSADEGNEKYKKHYESPYKYYRSVTETQKYRAEMPINYYKKRPKIIPVYTV